MDKGIIAVMLAGFLLLLLGTVITGGGRQQISAPCLIESTPPRYFYVAHVQSSAVATDKVHLLVWNNGSSPIYVARIMVASEVASAISGFHIVLRVQRVSGYSGGSIVPVFPLDTGYPAVSNVTAFTDPAVTGSQSLMSISVNQEETGGDVFRDIVLGDSPIVVRPGQGLAVTQYSVTGAGSLSVAIVFYTMG